MFWGLLMDAGTAEGSGTGTKTALTLTFLVLWGAGLVWMHKDAVYARLPGGVIDAFMAGGMAAGFIFFFATTNEALATTILSLFLATEIGMYLLLRNQTVGLDRLTAGFGGGIGWGGGGKTKGGLAGATTVVLLEKSGEAMAMPAGSSPMRAGYDALQNLLALPLDKNAGYIELKPADGAAERKFFVDGVGYRAEAMTRTAAAAVVGLVKQLAGLDQNEKRKPQTGSMKVVVGGKRKELRVETSGSAAGEELSITVDPKSQHLRRLEELGFDVDQLTQVKGMIAENGGMVLVATPKGQGMDSILYAMLREHDAFLSQIHTIEADTDTELEGVVQHRLSAGTNGAEAAKMVQLLTHQQADVVMASNVDSAALAAALVGFAETGKRVYVGVRASGITEALAVWCRLVGEARLAVKDLRMVVAGRLIRRLCPACKVGYQPSPEVLRKLNMDPERIGQLYQTGEQVRRDVRRKAGSCPVCKDLYFHGVAGIFETLRVDDEVRQVVESGAAANQLKALFRNQGGRYFQEQTLAMVEQGETSVQEVLRVLRQVEKHAKQAVAAG